MKDIRDWLEENVDEFRNGIAGAGDTAFEQHAERIRAAAEADGYTADELNDACGGDIADYLRGRPVVRSGVDDKMAGDAFPIPALGIKQE